MVAVVPDSPFDVDRIAAIADRLDLRRPNREALESIVFEIAQHYEVDREPPPFEAVVDVATGVGKTYILAAAIEYLAAEGVRNFAVIAPGRTILEKTVANFTPGHPKSLLGGMEVRPVVITSENFATAAMRAAMDDAGQVKLFIFTVQALTKPQTKLGRKTHKFQEGLGEAFYAHLQSLDDLTIFADEHHTYYGPAFSDAIRELHPRVLIGLTATPHKKTPPDQIIYRYPLAAAIADHLVKTPVLVGRKDDRTDPATKLLDGIRLLELKAALIERWRQENGGESMIDRQPVNPVMLVIAPKIDEAEEIGRIVESESFAGGRYVGKVLTVHSDAPDQALAALADVEEPECPYRIVISVGMLKEGWDVKNVYVIASLRASVSEILTEQTLGRGLRLPFGRYTGIELLDTLEVLGHERYEDLLKKAGVLNEQFIDLRTRAVLRRDAQNQWRSVTITEPVQAPLTLVAGDVHGGDGPTQEVPTIDHSKAPASIEPGHAGRPLVQAIEDHVTAAEEQLSRLQVTLAPSSELPPLRIPQLRMTAVQSPFSLADVIDHAPFRHLGETLSADPTGALRRVVLSAVIVEGADGIRRTELVTARAADRVEAAAMLFPLEELRRTLIDRILAAPAVPARVTERYGAGQIADAFLAGLGANAERILSAYFDRAAAGLIALITEEQRKHAAYPTYEEVVEFTAFAKVRIGRPETSRDRFGAFRKGIGYEGYRKSLYAQDWFDSSTEREAANTLEDEETITCWVRLQLGDLPILWTGGGREYNPDFIAIDSSNVHWLIEVKMDKEMASADVQGKREAAKRWANYVSADESVGAVWRYLLVSEADVATAKGSWEALRRLGDG